MGVLAMSVFSTFRGKELEDDPEFQKRMQDPHFREMIENSTKTTLDEKLPFSAKLSVAIFLSSLVFIVFLAVFPEIRTVGEGTKPISMGIVIQMVMLAFGALMLIFCKVPVAKVPNGVVFKSGMVA